MQLTQGLTRARSLQAESLAVVYGARRLTWVELVDRVARLAGGLRKLGMQTGDRVAMLADSSNCYIEFYYGACWGGGVFVPINLRLSEAEIIAQLVDAEPCALILDAAFVDRAAVFLAAVPSLRAILYVGDDAAPAGVDSYEDVIARGAPIEDHRRSGDDLAALFYTGGTTGRSKGVMLSHANLSINAMNSLAFLRLDGALIHLHAGPLYHLAAGARVFSVTLACGRHVVIPKFRTEEVLMTIERERVTNTSLVPTTLAMLLADPKFEATDLSSLSLISYGGSPIPEAILRRCVEALPQVGFAQAYGMTELSPIATYLSPADHRAEGGKRLRSGGRAVYSVDLEIVDAMNRSLPPGEIGEIVVRGPTVMQGYWRQPEMTRQVMRDGWLHTGDIGYLDEDGYLYVVDRKKDMIVSGGENIYSIEVEDAIHHHPDVAQCAVIGIPDEKWGEAVHAVVVRRSGSDIDAEAIVEYCRGQIAGYKCPRSVEFRQDPLPLSAVNKVNKASLRAAFWLDRGRAIN